MVYYIYTKYIKIYNNYLWHLLYRIAALWSVGMALKISTIIVSLKRWIFFFGTFLSKNQCSLRLKIDLSHDCTEPSLSVNKPLFLRSANRQFSVPPCQTSRQLIISRCKAPLELISFPINIMGWYPGGMVQAVSVTMQQWTVQIHFIGTERYLQRMCCSFYLYLPRSKPLQLYFLSLLSPC